MRALVVTNMYPTPERPALGAVRARPGRGAAAARRRRGRAVRTSPPARATTRAPRASCAAATRGQRFDVVHVHFGLVAWPALLAGLRPLVVTLHGNDLLHPRSRPFTRAALPLTALPAAVSRAFSANVPGAGRSAPRRDPARAASTSTRFRPIPRAEARARLGLDPAGPYLLFPHEPVAAAQALRPRARGGGRRPAAHARQRAAGGGPVLDQRRQRGDRALAGRGLRARGDRGVGVRRARRSARRSARTRSRWPGSRARRAWTWDRRALARGAARRT